MPLSFSGVIFVESVDASTSNSATVTASIVVEGASGFTFDMKLSVWVDVANSLYAPLAEELFQVEGKMTFKDEMFFIEAIRCFPAMTVIKMFPPMIFGTATYKGKPEEEKFSMASHVYAIGAAAEVTLITQHSSKQYGKIETTIKKDQEVYLFGILHEIDNGQMTLQRTQYSYLGKSSKAINDSVAATLDVIRVKEEQQSVNLSPRMGKKYQR